MAKEDTGNDVSIHVWRAGANRPLYRSPAVRMKVAYMSFNESESCLAWVSYRGEVTLQRERQIWLLNLETDDDAFCVGRIDAELESCAFSADHHWLATGAMDGTVSLWALTDLHEFEGERPPVSLKGHRDRISSLTFPK